jgi:hypothetical protein
MWVMHIEHHMTTPKKCGFLRRIKTFVSYFLLERSTYKLYTRYSPYDGPTDILGLIQCK